MFWREDPLPKKRRNEVTWQSWWIRGHDEWKSGKMWQYKMWQLTAYSQKVQVLDLEKECKMLFFFQFSTFYFLIFSWSQRILKTKRIIQECSEKKYIEKNQELGRTFLLEVYYSRLISWKASSTLKAKNANALHLTIVSRKAYDPLDTNLWKMFI